MRVFLFFKGLFKAGHTQHAPKIYFAAIAFKDKNNVFILVTCSIRASYEAIKTKKHIASKFASFFKVTIHSGPFLNCFCPTVSIFAVGQEASIFSIQLNRE